MPSSTLKMQRKCENLLFGVQNYGTKSHGIQPGVVCAVLRTLSVRYEYDWKKRKIMLAFAGAVC